MHLPNPYHSDAKHCTMQEKNRLCKESQKEGRLHPQKFKNAKSHINITHEKRRKKTRKKRKKNHPV